MRALFFSSEIISSNVFDLITSILPEGVSNFIVYLIMMLNPNGSSCFVISIGIALIIIFEMLRECISVLKDTPKSVSLFF